MKRIRRRAVVCAAGVGLAAAAMLAAPTAGADDLLPQCEDVSGSSISGGQTTECATPGNTQLDATPQVLPGEGEEFYGFPAFGFI